MQDDRHKWKDQRTCTFTFTFMHLADAFIQSDLHCIQVTVLHFLSSFFVDHICRSCFDHFESDRDVVVSERDAFTDT